MLDQPTIRGRLVAAALKLAAERPWREVTLANIAAAAGVSLVDVRREFDSKADTSPRSCAWSMMPCWRARRSAPARSRRATRSSK